MLHFTNCMPTKRFAIRHAEPADGPTIRAMVHREGLDPTQLKVENFLVAVTPQNGQPRIIGCGQMREFPGAQELGSLVVEPDWRSQGVGATLVQWLVAGASDDVYLECRADLASYYRQFGFELVGWTDLPPALKLKFGLGRLFSLLPGVSIVAMQWVGLD